MSGIEKMKQQLQAMGIEKTEQQLQAMAQNAQDWARDKARRDAISWEKDKIAQWLREGRAEGRAEGLAEGRAEGERSGKAKAILAVLAARAISVDETVRERLLSCRDEATLDRWLVRAATAIHAADVIAG